MFWAFGGFLFFKGILLAVISLFCKFNAGFVICIAVGMFLEGFVSILLDDKGNPTAKEIFYFIGLLMQIIPMIIITVHYFSLAEEKINFIKAIALGWMCIIATVGWFTNGIQGAVSFAYYYGVSIGVLAVEGILSAMTGLHTLLIINAVVSALAVVAVLLGRLKLGNNLE